MSAKIRCPRCAAWIKSDFASLDAHAALKCGTEAAPAPKPARKMRANKAAKKTTKKKASKRG